MACAVQGFLAWCWQEADDPPLLVIVNYSPSQGQCYVRVPLEGVGGRTVRLRDTLGEATFDRSGSDLLATGLYLDVPGWGYHAFEIDLLS